MCDMQPYSIVKTARSSRRFTPQVKYAYTQFVSGIRTGQV